MLTAAVLGTASTPGSILGDRNAAASSSRSTTPGSATSVAFRGIFNGDDGNELVWWKRRVIWSRRSVLYRQYSFEKEEEDIAYALFATFPPKSSSSIIGKEVGFRQSGTFGPFHDSQSAKWGAPRASTSANLPTTALTALIVLLQTRAHIFFPSGENTSVHLPYPIERAWSLPDGGIMVQRALDRKEKRRNGRAKSVLRGMDQTYLSALDELDDMEDDKPRQPRLSILMGPLEEFKAVVEGSVQLSPGGDGLAHSEDIDLDRSVLFSSASPPFVILHSRHSGQLIFTRRVRVPITPTPPAQAITPRNTRPSDLIMPDPVPPAARPSLRRNVSSFAGDRRSSGLADPLDRAQRRAPRLSRALEADPGPGELQRTLVPEAVPSTLNKGKMKARVVEEKRRESGASAFMRDRDDLHSIGRTALHRADEWDLRETTMLMGLEREEVERSGIVLDRIWAWTPPDGFDADTANIFLSDNLSTSSVIINIHSPNLRQLYTFQAIYHPGDRWQISPRSAISCISAIPITSTRPNVLDTLTLSPEGTFEILTSFDQAIPLRIPLPPEGDDVAHKLASSLHMTIEEDVRMSSDRPSSRIDHLYPGQGSEFTAILRSGERLRCSVDFVLPHGLARSAMEALSYALPAQAFSTIKKELVSARSSAKQSGAWSDFDQVLRTAFGLPIPAPAMTSFDELLQEGFASTDKLIARLTAKVRARDGRTDVHDNPRLNEPILDPAYIPSVIMALHLVGQECRVNLSGRQDLARIAELIRDLAAAVGRIDWWDYWMRISPSDDAQLGAARYEVDTMLLEVYDQPPDILSYLSRRLSRPLKPFPTPSMFFTHTSEYGSPDPSPQTQLIVNLFDKLGPSSEVYHGAISPIDRAYATVQYMVDQNLGQEWLADRPAWIAIPILEVMKLCQIVSRRNMPAEVYDLVGRTDLQLQSRGDVNMISHPEQDVVETMPSVGDLMAGNISRTVQLNLPHVRFGADRRLREVERILQANRIRTISIETKGGSDAEIAQYQQSMVNTIAQRTLAVLVGQGIFEFGTRNTAITTGWEIPLIELSVKLSPTNSLLKAQIHGEHVDWPCFHNGVSAALSISADCKGIDSAWIVLNKPTPLNPEHGGFLLGLGLTGHLRQLKTYHAFPYMEARHDFTSVGLLLGLASSYAGSEDILITKTLSLHTHALLPMGSMALNAAPIVQSTAIVGLGLVYAGSKNLRMAEVTLGEIGRKEMSGIDNFADYQESYSFSSAAAFGLIMLGRGGQAASEVDRRMLGKLRRCIHGDGPDLRKGVIPIDTTITGAGATLALGLMYLKSNRSDIRDILEIPSTALALDLVRPDLLLPRTFARGLIMWDSISPSLTWIEEQLPPFIRSQVKGHKRIGGLELATDLAYINIIGGACLAIGLKFAGTASEMAHNNLMLFFHVLSRSAGTGSMAYESRIRRSAARQALNIVTIAICCVMSGTGELQVLRRLRISHGQEGVGVTYGTHMAMHMAVGLLFLGRGQYTLGTSNLAIAAMSIAFFPRFMHTPDDNRAYPQALRHLWALAVEPRCLMARDADNGETVYLPIRVKLREGDSVRSQNLISPTLIAPFDNLVSIEVDSPRYWPITYDFSDPTHRAALVRTRTIHVKRRLGHQDYNSDPKGNRSIFIRAGGVTGFDLHYDLLSPAAPPSIPASEVADLVFHHSPFVDHHGLANLMCGDTAYEQFIRTVLLECVTLDKPLALSVYMGLMAPAREGGAEGGREIEMLRHYYAKVWDTMGNNVPGLPEKRIALIRPAFLAALSRRSVEISEEIKRAYLVDGECGEGVAEWLVKERIPALPLLQMLKQRVKAASDEGQDEEMIVTRVTEVTKVYEMTLGRVWDLDGAESGTVDMGSTGWKVDSLREAVSAWTAA